MQFSFRFTKIENVRSFWLVSLCFCASLSHADSCRERIAAHLAAAKAHRPHNVSIEFVKYLHSLVQIRILSVKDLETFLNQLGQGHWINPLEENQVSRQFFSVPKQLHYESLAQYIASRLLNRNEVAQELALVLRRELWTRDDLIDAQRLSQSSLFGSFFRVEPGQFNFKGHHVQLTYPIGVQSTLVTREMWKDVMGGLPENYKNTMRDQGLTDPVTDISLLSAMIFANQISLRSGLKPVYDLDRFSPDIRSAAEGMADFQSNVKVQLTGPSVYESEGYRLPTQMEQLYLLSNLGQHWHEPFGLTLTDFLQFAWLPQNPPNGRYTTLQPVGEKRPFAVGTGLFSDLFGNVLWWNSDGDLSLAENNVDPYSLPSQFCAIEIYGMAHSSIFPAGTWASEPLRLSGNHLRPFLGLRLVRSLTRRLPNR